MTDGKLLLPKTLFGDAGERVSAFRSIRDLAATRDIRLTSINELYLARGRGDVPHTFTVPAVNLRGFTYRSARAIIRAAKEIDGFVIFELARSEMRYTAQHSSEYASEILAAAIDEGWVGPLFLQADHTQFKSVSPGVPADGEMESIRELIVQDMAAGFYNIDIDGSTLVDLSQPMVSAQQKTNIAVTGELLAFIRERQPEQITVSIGGEIGHIGDTNSTPEDMQVFMEGIAPVHANKFPGLSKVSVQTGTRHGGVIDAVGKTEAMNVDFNVIDSLGTIARKYGAGGVVQHGASTLADSQLSQFPAHQTLEIHLATGWQNLVMDHPAFPADLMHRVGEWVDVQYLNERKLDQTEAQFHYRMRKYAWGQIRREVWELPNEVQDTLATAVYERAKVIFRELGIRETRKYLELCEG